MLGVLVAWVLVRYDFPLKRLFDSLVDLPFALPTAVAGLVYSSLLVKGGWFGRFLVPLGIQGAYSRLGIVLVLVFIGFPFVVRTLQPVLEGLERDVEEAAACLGANRFQTVTRVILPSITPAIITGFALAFARSLGEYGSVVFISGNMPFRTEIAPVLVVARLEEFDYAEATAIAIVLLADLVRHPLRHQPPRTLEHASSWLNTHRRPPATCAHTRTRPSCGGSSSAWRSRS